VRERTMTVSKLDESSLVNSQREYSVSGCTRSSSWRMVELEAVRYPPCTEHTLERKLEGEMMMR
jgi:hypothetical protein